MRLRPSPALLAIAVGVLVGVGLATFRYAEGASYLSTDPAACANCHIMQTQYDSWQKSSHHTVATCVECHLPADFVGKYVAKAENGWNHSVAFTLQSFPEPIRMTPKNQGILQANCLRCHASIVHALVAGERDSPLTCARCHAGVGHGERLRLGGPWRGVARNGPEVERKP